MPQTPQLKTKPFDDAREVRSESDIADLSFASSGLKIDVALELREGDQVHGLRVSFSDACAVRYLDEADLARYWTSSGFVRGHCVLEVTEGGWSDEENEFQGFATSRREWLIVTGNGCVSVFAASEPSIKEHVWPRDA